MKCSTIGHNLKLCNFWVQFLHNWIYPSSLQGIKELFYFELQLQKLSSKSPPLVTNDMAALASRLWRFALHPAFLEESAAWTLTTIFLHRSEVMPSLPVVQVASTAAPSPLVRCVRLGVRCVGLSVQCIGLGVKCIGHGPQCIGLGIQCVGLGLQCIGLGVRFVRGNHVCWIHGCGIFFHISSDWSLHLSCLIFWLFFFHICAWFM